MLENKYEDKAIDYYDNYRSDIIPLLPKHSARALEIGCGTGNTLAYLKANGYCDWTYGVEMFPEALDRAASNVDILYSCNIEGAVLPIEPHSINLILCLDVLEHLVNPEKVISYLHTLLAPGGIIIASIPNVRHYSVVFPLVFKNEWEYKNAGVLDSTHLRFFVKKTAIDLMESSGLKLEDLVHSGLFTKKQKILSAITFGAIRSFCTLQYLIKVSNNP
jgi:SAM-dependent methyltransferase